ncbi:MAG: MBL fold metallo-hydrolase [Candidatus Omnitrophota bacterium]|nr:MBL fold metallo-hydrolase [Candidatus Omnitrophota bacterium]
MILEHIIVGSMEVNCYLLGSETSKDAVIIDPGDDYPKIKKLLERLKLNPKFIINTHGHMDHIGADDKFNLPVYIHRLDAGCLINPEKNLSAMFGLAYSVKSVAWPLDDGKTINLENLNLEIIHTPGHTPGSICIKVNNIVFTGDTLFQGGIGRTDFPGASESNLFRSIREKLLTLDDETIIYPGHGPNSTIGQERKSNPFLIGI